MEGQAEVEWSTVEVGKKVTTPLDTEYAFKNTGPPRWVFKLLTRLGHLLGSRLSTQFTG